MIIPENCRLALDKAYELLATGADADNSTGICFYDFLMFMHYYQPLTRKQHSQEYGQDSAYYCYGCMMYAIVCS